MARIYKAQETSMQAQPFSGVPYVGAVFSSKNGQPANHFATAFVVTSKAGDLLMSAAHILLNRDAADLLFIPGYTQGHTPHGVWSVSESYVTAAWQKEQSINDDFCFLKVTAGIQGSVGSLSLLTGASPQTCEVIGYPDGMNGPVHATVPAAWYTPQQQLTFNCGGYPNGTSGSPWIVKNSAYGLIGGYQQGGNSPATSYSPYFGGNVQALYNTATGA
jgi:hypothetical protein